MNTTPSLISPAGVHDQTGAPAWSLAQDPAVETARLLGLLMPDNSLNPVADAYAGLAGLNQRLIDAPEAEILEALTRQAALLEALHLTYTRKALDVRKPEHAALLQGVALKCQKSLIGVLGAIRTMNEGRRNVEAIETGD